MDVELKNRGTEKHGDVIKRHSSSISSSLSEIEKPKSAHGLNTWQAAFFVLGEVAGSGVLALPNAMLGTGYIGIVLLLALCLMAGYSGYILGQCWIVTEELYPELAVDSRQPYQIMGQHTYGTWMRWLVTICIYGTLLGGGIVFILLIAGMLQQLLQDAWPESICYWTMIVAAVMIPLSWLGTPKDFWMLAIVASVTVVLASLLLTAQCLLDIAVFPSPRYPQPTFEQFSLSFGAIVFAYGGASAFPTVQNDMKNRLKFPKSAVMGFIGILCVYLPLTCAGYFVFGSLVTPNVALTVSSGPLRMTAQILLIIHLFCAFVVLVNPCFQDIEQHLNIKPGFSIFRCLARTGVVLFALFIAETVPDFSKIQNLIGGSTITLQTFVMPALFYIKLVNTQNKNLPADQPPKRTISYQSKAFMWEIVVIGILGGIVSTISAVYAIASPNALSVPCYVSILPVPASDS